MTFETLAPERNLSPIRGVLEAGRKQCRIIGALLMREMATRYGRTGLGFAWVVAEPLAFCFGVMILWGVTKPAYEHGVRLSPFVMTGYMSLVIIRHLIGLMASAIQSNTGLLYHRQIKPVHILFSRALLEVGGGTIAYFIVYVVLLAIGQVSLPNDYLLLYAGWFTLIFNAIGVALIIAGLAMIFEAFERLTSLISYAIIPISGAFFMVGWLPPGAREIFLKIPLVHGIEMMRSSVFGENVATYYDAPYAIAWAASMIIAGLLLIAYGRDRIDSE